MRRMLIDKMLEWKDQKSRKPLLLDGARQVGKSYLLIHELGKFFPVVHLFDFRETKELGVIFDESQKPDQIIKSLEIFSGNRINVETDLIVFDEIGECQGAIDSLKYFAEKMPLSFIVSSGSNLGLISSFPVGKTNNLQLFPMTFYEFLQASSESILTEEYEKQVSSSVLHVKLWAMLLDYFYVGGMPEAVKAWFDEENITDKIRRVNEVHRDLLVGYQRDFGKYGGRTNALQIEAVFENIPRQIMKVVDDSISRFEFKEVIPGKKRYSELRGPIDWLEKSKLISKNYIIQSQPLTPLKALSKDNIFKLLFFDIGLLNCMLDINYREIISQKYSFKGYIAENFVQNELRVLGRYPTYSWKERNCEIEFILKTKFGKFIPCEVKSGKRTKAKSLKSFIERYKPDKTIKFTGSVGSQNSQNLTVPLYYVGYSNKLLEED